MSVFSDRLASLDGEISSLTMLSQQLTDQRAAVIAQRTALQQEKASLLLYKQFCADNGRPF